MMRAMTQRFTCLAAASLLAACAYEHAVAPLDAEARAEIWPLSVETAPPIHPSAPYTPHSRGKGQAALAGAGGSVLVGTLGGASGGPLGMAFGAALGIALAPFVALGFAIAMPSNESLQEAGAEIAAALTETQWEAALKDAVEKSLAQHGHPVAQDPDADAGRLKLSLKGPWMVMDGFSGLPALAVHGELAKGEACLMDRHWRWNGTTDGFADLGDDQAEDYRAQMDDGLAALAEAVVSDLLASDQAHVTRYADEETFQRGGSPLVVTQPLEAQDQVGSWDNTSDTRCEGLRSANLAPLAPAKEACHAPGCRVAG
jgi:hypothetical protein